MDNTEQDRNNIEVAESIESKWMVNHLESGLPRWLIEAAFVCYLLQATINWTPLMHWMEDHASWASATIQTFGPAVMYVGLMRGMRRLYRPMTFGWWVIIVLNIAGFIPLLFPSLTAVGLPLAVSLMLVYLPLGCAIAFSYRGRLRQVGIWMALYILISSIIPVVSFLLVGPKAGHPSLGNTLPSAPAYRLQLFPTLYSEALLGPKTPLME